MIVRASISQRLTGSKVILWKFLSASKSLAPVITKGDDLCFDAHPSKVSLEGAGYMRLAARWKADGEDEDLSCMEKQAGFCCVERCDHRGCLDKITVT